MAVITIGLKECELSAAYSNIWFTASELTPIDQPSPAITVTVFCRSNNLGTISHQLDYKPEEVLPITDILQSNVYFISTEEIVQCCFDNEASLCEPKTQDATQVNDCIVETWVEICSWLPDEEGCLKKEDEVVTSQILRVINGKLEQCDEQCYDEFTEPIPRKVFTNKPVKSLVCLNDSECVCFYSQGMAAMTVTSYDINLAPLESGVVEGQATPNVIQCFGVGPENINASPWQNGAVTIDANVHYYDILFFDATGLVNRRRYYVDPCCCTAYRIHFLNCYGKWDSVSVRKNQEDFAKITGKTFEKGLPISGNNIRAQDYQRSRGINTLRKIAQRGFVAHLQSLSDEELDWLLELAMSPNIFLEKDCKYIPIYSDSKNYDLKDRYAIDNEVELTFTYSTSFSSQRN